MQKAGAVGGIVVDNAPSSSGDAAPLFAMSGDGTEDVKVNDLFNVSLAVKQSSFVAIYQQIPLVFLYSSDADLLMKALEEDLQMQVTLAESSPDHGNIRLNLSGSRKLL